MNRRDFDFDNPVFDERPLDKNGDPMISTVELATMAGVSRVELDRTAKKFELIGGIITDELIGSAYLIPQNLIKRLLKNAGVDGDRFQDVLAVTEPQNPNLRGEKE